MKGKGAEAAASEASAVAGKAEPDFIQSRNPPLTVVHRMPGSHIGKIINIIHLLSTERQRRRILDHIAPCAVILDQRFCRKRICISVLNGKTFRIGFFAVSDLIKRRKRHWVIGGICCFTFVNSTWYVGDLFYRNTAVQGICNFNDRMFSHSVRDQICAGIKKHTSFYPVLPVIIVGQTS